MACPVRWAGLASAGTVSNCRDCGTVALRRHHQQVVGPAAPGWLIGASIGGVVGQHSAGPRQGCCDAAFASVTRRPGHQPGRIRQPQLLPECSVDHRQRRHKLSGLADPADLTRRSRVRVSGRTVELIEV